MKSVRLSIELKEYDYDSIIAALKKIVHADKGVKALLVKLIGMIPSTGKDKLLMVIIGNKHIKKKLCSCVESELAKQGVSITVNELSIRETKERTMKLCLGVGNYNYSEIIELVIEKLNGNSNEYVKTIGIPALNVINNTLSDG